MAILFVIIGIGFAVLVFGSIAAGAVNYTVNGDQSNKPTPTDAESFEPTPTDAASLEPTSPTTADYGYLAALIGIVVAVVVSAILIINIGGTPDERRIRKLMERDAAANKLNHQP